VAEPGLVRLDAYTEAHLSVETTKAVRHAMLNTTELRG